MRVHALLVSSEPVLLAEKERSLRHAGLAVATAATSDDAWQLFLNGDFDVVLLCCCWDEVQSPLADRISRRSPSTPILKIAGCATGSENTPAGDGNNDAFLAAAIEHAVARSSIAGFPDPLPAGPYHNAGRSRPNLR